MHPQKGLVAQLNSALDYGSRGCWFESSRGHKRIENPQRKLRIFLIIKYPQACLKGYFIIKKIIKPRGLMGFQFSKWSFVRKDGVNPVTIFLERVFQLRFDGIFILSLELFLERRSQSIFCFS